MAGDPIRDLLTAKADALVRQAADELAALIHDDFIYVNAGGRTFGKEGYVDLYCRSGRVVFLAQEIAEVETRLFEGFAVVSLLLRDRFVAGGQTTAATYRSLCTLAKADGAWLWAAGQTMPMAGS